jgi:hypothetical protein
MPILYHITDYGAVDNLGIPSGSILHTSPEDALSSWGRDNNHKTKPIVYKVRVPWSGVSWENERFVAKQTLHDVVFHPYTSDTDPSSMSPVDRAYTTTRRRTPPEDRFNSVSPFVSRTPAQITTEPQFRTVRGPHNMTLLDMTRKVAVLAKILRRIATRGKI